MENGQMENITEEQKKVLLKAQQGELNAVVMYQKLAEQIKNPQVAAVLRELAQDEGRHAGIFHKMTGVKLKPKKAQAIFVSTAARIIGTKKIFSIIAKGEYDAEQTYAPVVKDFPEVAAIQQDEKKHGDRVTELIKLL